MHRLILVSSFILLSIQSAEAVKIVLQNNREGHIEWVCQPDPQTNVVRTYKNLRVFFTCTTDSQSYTSPTLRLVQGDNRTAYAMFAIPAGARILNFTFTTKLDEHIGDQKKRTLKVTQTDVFTPSARNRRDILTLKLTDLTVCTKIQNLRYDEYYETNDEKVIQRELRKSPYVTVERDCY